MVPAIWEEMDSFPITASGKIDRKALPDPELAATTGYAAPRNDMEANLAEIWQDLLEVDQVGIYDNFFDLGGHSLLAVRLVSIILKKLGIDIDIATLFIYPTVAELGTYLVNNSKKKLQSLIPIKTSGNKAPLYIVCGAGGTVFKFREFVQLLDPEQPIYGLQQAVSNNNIDEFPDTIEGIATRYIEEMVSENPAGPYALSGHCLGGTIAFEMANQLKEMGKEVSLLAMFDTDVRERRVRIPPSAKNFYHIPKTLRRLSATIPRKIKFEWFLLTKHPKQALLYKMTMVKPFFGTPEPKPENIEQDVFDKLTSKIEKASTSYKMKMYDGDIVLFAAMQHFFFVDTVNKIIYKEMPVNYESKYAWKKYARSVDFYEVKGEHSTIFDAVNATEFSQILQHYLDERPSANHQFQIGEGKKVG
jgi:thioesterase domain-containing protein/acyl carrier protein